MKVKSFCCKVQEVSAHPVHGIFSFCKKNRFYIDSRKAGTIETFGHFLTLGVSLSCQKKNAIFTPSITISPLYSSFKSPYIHIYIFFYSTKMAESCVPSDITETYGKKTKSYFILFQIFFLIAVIISNTI